MINRNKQDEKKKQGGNPADSKIITHSYANNQMRNDTMNNNIPPHTLSRLLEKYLSNLDNKIPLTKNQHVLAWIIVASNHQRAVTRFDAEIIGDHCFNTTISELGHKDNILISRKRIKVPTRFGRPTQCKQYWLEPDAALKAEIYLLKSITRH